MVEAKMLGNGASGAQAPGDEHWLLHLTTP